KASENLYVSQPGISQQIHLLENQLGVSLFHRSTRKVELTEEGKYLYDRTFASFTEIEQTVSNFIDSKSYPKLINIATIPSAASLYLPKVLKKIHTQHPNFEFNIKETTSTDVMNLINDRTYHLGFIRTTNTSPIQKQKNTEFLEFERSPIKVVISSQHELAHRTSIALKELQDEFFLNYDPSESAALYNLLEDVCDHAGFKPKTICTGAELLTTSNIISNNLAVTLMPNDMLEIVSNKHIKAIDIADVHVESSIAAVWRNDRYLNLNTKSLVDILTDFDTYSI